MSSNLSPKRQKDLKTSSKIKFSDLLRSSLLPRLETEILAAFLLKKSRIWLLAHPETLIRPAILKKFQELETKRLKNWPLAYLIGQQGFYGLDFKVNPSTLIPRPETEMMVDEMIEIIKNINSYQNLSIKKTLKTQKQDAPQRHSPQAKIIDIGTGSGAIIIATAATSKRLFPALFKNISFYALDISAQALKVAKQNAKSHRLETKIKFYHSNLLTALKKQLLSRQKSAANNTHPPLIISANLPYLTPNQIKNSPSISREPRLALLGGRDGLKYYRLLAKQIYALNLKSALTVLCEIDPSQAGPLKKIFQKYWPTTNVNIKKDLAGYKRIVKISL